MAWWIKRLLALVAIVSTFGFVVGGGIVVAKQVISDAQLPPAPEAE